MKKIKKKTTKCPALTVQEWYNQKREGINYFRFFDYSTVTYFCWVASITDPYLPIYDLKLLHMEAAEPGHHIPIFPQWGENVQLASIDPLMPKRYFCTTV